MNNAYIVAQMNRFGSVDNVGRDLPPRSAPINN